MYASPEVNRVIRVYRQFRHARGRDPSAEEIAAELHMPVGKVRGLIARAQAPVDWETGASEPEHPLSNRPLPRPETAGKIIMNNLSII